MTAQRAEIRRQAQAIAEYLEEADPGVLSRLCENPLGELEKWPGLQVRRLAEVDAGDGCSVAGSYRSDTTPPTLCVAWSVSSGRRQFTILHELAHHIQRNNAELAAVLMTSADPDDLEEAACNLFAALALLPDAIVDRHIGAKGPSAAEVGRPAQRLPGVPGGVLCPRGRTSSWAGRRGAARLPRRSQLRVPRRRVHPARPRIGPVGDAAGNGGSAVNRPGPHGNLRAVPHRRHE